MRQAVATAGYLLRVWRNNVRESFEVGLAWQSFCVGDASALLCSVNVCTLVYCRENPCGLTEEYLDQRCLVR